MDLTSARPFWLIRNGIGNVSPPLPGDSECDVAVIGGGITGALIADALTAHSLHVLVVDRRHPGHGSTAASTALLQYEIDVHLVDLIEKLGKSRAIDAYHANLEGVQRIEELACSLGDEVEFTRRSSLYVAARPRHARNLIRECDARRAAGLPCEVIGEAELKTLVDFPARLALRSNTAGEVDPWRLTRALLARAAGRGCSIYGRTDVSSITPAPQGLDVHTDRGRIRARHVIVATGYEGERLLPKPVAALHSTFAIVTEPVDAFPGWEHRSLIWQSSRPYLYARTTSDRRILVGGEDIPFKNQVHRDARLPSKATRLIDQARRLFPRITMETAYAWAGTFGETKDGLPYIGPHPNLDPNLIFALGYGGNGMTFGAVAATIVAAMVMKQPHRYQQTFAFDR